MSPYLYYFYYNRKSFIKILTFEPVYDKTYNKTCVTSKDSGQPAHPPSMARVLAFLSLDSLKTVESTCDQRYADRYKSLLVARLAMHWLNSFQLTHFSLETPKRVIGKPAHPDQMLHNAVSEQGLHCL